MGIDNIFELLWLQICYFLLLCYLRFEYAIIWMRITSSFVLNYLVIVLCADYLESEPVLDGVCELLMSPSRFFGPSNWYYVLIWRKPAYILSKTESFLLPTLVDINKWWPGYIQLNRGKENDELIVQVSNRDTDFTGIFNF